VPYDGGDFYEWMCVDIPRLFYIAPNTAYVTTAEANEICCKSLVASLSLDGIKMFHERQ
jgi:hypothetical protein